MSCCDIYWCDGDGNVFSAPIGTKPVGAVSGPWVEEEDAECPPSPPPPPPPPPVESCCEEGDYPLSLTASVLLDTDQNCESALDSDWPDARTFSMSRTGSFPNYAYSGSDSAGRSFALACDGDGVWTCLIGQGFNNCKYVNISCEDSLIVCAAEITGGITSSCNPFQVTFNNIQFGGPLCGCEGGEFVPVTVVFTE